MIRAYLASFPPRRALMLATVARIAPQVDRLFVVLNEYPALPEELAFYPNVEAVVPPVDMKDFGKFRFAPAPDDLVFLIDDDIGYPPDYVARSRALAEPLGLAGNVFGYHGHALVQDRNAAGLKWRNFMFHRFVGKTRGVNVLGTGTMIARGANVPPLSAMAGAVGYADIRCNDWLHRHGLLPWVLPREKDWLTNELPEDLRASSLFEAVNRNGSPAPRAELQRFVRRRPHVDTAFEKFDHAGFRARTRPAEAIAGRTGQVAS